MIFSGNSVPEASHGEICSNIIQKLVQDELKIKLKPEDISVAHRLGKKPINQVPDKRGIIVKLCRRETKRELLMAKRSLPRTNSSSLFINESLTPKRNTILYALRQMKKAHPNIIAGCSSYDGRIYAYTKTTPDSSAFRETTSSPATRNVRHLINIMLASPIFATISSRNHWTIFSTHGTIKTHTHVMVNNFHHILFIPIIPINLYLKLHIILIFLVYFTSKIYSTFHFLFTLTYVRCP